MVCVYIKSRLILLKAVIYNRNDMELFKELTSFILNYTFDLGYCDELNEIKITINDNEKCYYLSNTDL